MSEGAVATKSGIFLARYSDQGLVSLTFPPNPDTGSSADVPQAWQKLAAAALERCLAGNDPGPLPPLDWSAATEFQRRVWKALLAIPMGQTKSYAEIALEVGTASGGRAVGNACGANPIPVLVPCHRVLARDGKIGGFSAGLHWKRLLLEREGVFMPLA